MQCMIASYVYKVSVSEEVRVRVSYTVYTDGSIQVKSAYQGAPGLPKLPIFPLSFKGPADYDKLDWYANGPEENYIDRAFGARLCASAIVRWITYRHTWCRRNRATAQVCAKCPLPTIKAMALQ